jgi:shikimate dehydrogenase
MNDPLPDGAPLEISAATRLIALLGDPVAHSLSPAFQNAAFRAAGVDGAYLALQCGAADLPGLLLGIARAGGAGNVTVPHKALAARTVELPTREVERTGACNTFWLEGGRVCGDNTDVAGFRAAVHALVGDPAGMRVLLLGAGGAARAAVAALLDDGVDAIHLLNRTPARAAELLEAFPASGAGMTTSGATTLQVVQAATSLRAERFDLVVNATSLGLRTDDPLPLTFDAVGEFGAALDLVYAPGETRWVREARAQGIPAADGIEMLLHQGAAAFERWWGRPAPLEAMRAALDNPAPPGR